MKKVEIIVRGQYQKEVEALLDRVHVSGYTIIPNISGRGHHGLHEGAPDVQRYAQYGHDHHRPPKRKSRYRAGRRHPQCSNTIPVSSSSLM